jgi:hypothetical protein
MDDDCDFAKVMRNCQSLERIAKHRATGANPILFRLFPAKTRSAAGGKNQ